MISLHHGAWNMHGREACLCPILAEKFSLTLHMRVSCSCRNSCTSSLEVFPTLQKILTYQVPYERFTVLQGCWFYLLCCDTILKSYTKARWITPRKPVSLSTAGLFTSSRQFCSFHWSSGQAVSLLYLVETKPPLGVSSYFQRKWEVKAQNAWYSGNSWAKSACKCSCGQRTWAVCRAGFSSVLYSTTQILVAFTFQLKMHQMLLCLLLFRLSKKIYERQKIWLRNPGTIKVCW